MSRLPETFISFEMPVFHITISGVPTVNTDGIIEIIRKPIGTEFNGDIVATHTIDFWIRQSVRKEHVHAEYRRFQAGRQLQEIVGLL